MGHAAVGAGTVPSAPGRHPPARALKFRQAAFAYLLVGLLYESAVYSGWQAGIVPLDRGPVWGWLLAGAAVVAVVFAALWWWQNVWVPRVVFVLQAGRLPAIVAGGFLPESGAQIPADLYRVALLVVLVNLWMLARAGWDV